jgi:hypothetical protein
MNSHTISTPVPVPDYSVQPCWSVNILRHDEIVVASLVLHKTNLPPRCARNKRIVWKLPSSYHQEPTFGRHEQERIWELYKQQKKERRKLFNANKESGGAKEGVILPAAMIGLAKGGEESTNGLAKGTEEPMNDLAKGTEETTNGLAKGDEGATNVSAKGDEGATNVSAKAAEVPTSGTRADEFTNGSADEFTNGFAKTATSHSTRCDHGETCVDGVVSEELFAETVAPQDVQSWTQRSESTPPPVQAPPGFGPKSSPPGFDRSYEDNTTTIPQPFSPQSSFHVESPAQLVAQFYRLVQHKTLSVQDWLDHCYARGSASAVLAARAQAADCKHQMWIDLVCGGTWDCHGWTVQDVVADTTSSLVVIQGRTLQQKVTLAFHLTLLLVKGECGYQIQNEILSLTPCNMSS